VGLGGLEGIALGVGRKIEDRENLAAAAATAGAAGLRHLVEDVVEREVVGLLERVELVVVAARAIEGQAEPDGGGGLDAVEDVFDARLLGDAAALAVEHVVAVKTTRDFLLARSRGEEIAGELFDGELVERHVGVEGVHDPVAPRPHGALGVALESVGVGVASDVQPVPSPAFAIARRGEEAVDDFGVGVGRTVGDEGGGLGEGGGRPVRSRETRRMSSSRVAAGAGESSSRTRRAWTKASMGLPIADLRLAMVGTGGRTATKAQAFGPRGTLGDPATEKVFLGGRQSFVGLGVGMTSSAS